MSSGQSLQACMSGLHSAAHHILNTSPEDFLCLCRFFIYLYLGKDTYPWSRRFNFFFGLIFLKVHIINFTLYCHCEWCCVTYKHIHPYIIHWNYMLEVAVVSVFLFGCYFFPLKLRMLPQKRKHHCRFTHFQNRPIAWKIL